MGAPVLVTRAQPGAEETAARLRALGCDPIVSPALALALASPVPAFDMEGAQGLVFTSANGVRFFLEAGGAADLTAWCVGPATTAAARAAGFAAVHESAGDAGDLARFIAARAEPAGGRLVHIANAAAAGILKESLTAKGFAVDFVPLYEAREATVLAREARAALEAGDLAAVLFHSAKGAHAFARLAAGADLAGTTAIAISAKALAPATPLGWKDRRIADAPNEDALMAEMERLLTTL